MYCKLSFIVDKLSGMKTSDFLLMSYWPRFFILKYRVSMFNLCISFCKVVCMATLW